MNKKLLKILTYAMKWKIWFLIFHQFCNLQRIYYGIERWSVRLEDENALFVKGIWNKGFFQQNKKQIRVILVLW